MFQISPAGKIFSLYIVFLILFFALITSANNSAFNSKQKLNAQNIRSQLTTESNNLHTEKTNITSQSKVAEQVKGFMSPINRADNSFQSITELQDKKTTQAESVTESENSKPAKPVVSR
jgi:hypothetical protein